MSKIIGYLILCCVASAIACFAARDVFKDEKRVVVVGTYLTIVAIMFAIVMVVRFALHLIL